MNKKYLIVSGDSFTEGHMMGEQASWAYWVSKKMNLELINLSCGGASNEWISNNLLSYLTGTDISLDECVVMVGWSDLSRQMVFLDNIKDEVAGFLSVVPGDLTTKSDSMDYDLRLKWLWDNRKTVYPFFTNLSYAIFKTYQSIFYTKLFLENKNIPYIFFDVISDNKVVYKNNLPYIKGTWRDFNSKSFDEVPYVDDLISSMLSQDNVNFIFNKNYINFEGYPILGWLMDGRYEYEEGNDGHTNIKGAEKISEYIIDNFKKIYQ